jgi:hypothetical protein
MLNINKKLFIFDLNKNFYLSDLKAFTITEVSIVILIIGFIISSVTAGNNLIKNARIRSVVTEITQFRTATNNFKTVFNAIPGDYAKASIYWPTCDANGASVAANCNGNGDNIINQNTTGYVGVELFRFWQHLMLAGMLQGNYSGLEKGSLIEVVGSNVNSPVSNYGGNGVYYVSYAAPAGNSISDNYFVLGRLNGSSSLANYAYLLPSAAQNIDLKIDDGTPFSGSTKAQNGTSATSTCTSGSGLTMTYNNTNANKDCYMFFTIYD